MISERAYVVRFTRFLTAVAGAGLLALPVVAPATPAVSAAPILVVASGIGALLLAATAGTRFRAFGAWAATAVAGQAAALQLTRAGTAVGYQHFAIFLRLESLPERIAVSMILLQTLAALALVVRHRGTIGTRLSADLGSWRLAIVGSVFVLTSATLSPSLPVYVSELALAAAVQIVNAVTVAAAVTSLPTDLLEKATGWLSRQRRSSGEPASGRRIDVALPLAAAAWIAGVAVLLAVTVYERHPHIADEVVYLLQARYLAEGQLWLPTPPVPEAFELDLMFLDGDRWYSPVPPGWPAVLAVGAFLGEPWLVNPLLAALSVLLAHRLFSHLYDARTARVGTLLLALSPWFVFLSMSVMNHTAILTAGLASAVAVARLRETGRLRWAAAAGLGVGIVALMRPLDGVLVGLVLGCWVLTARETRRRVAPVAAFAVSAAAMIVPLLAYNQFFTGDATVFPIMEYTRVHYGPGANALGFGPDRGLGWGGFDPFPGHDLLDALINTNLNAFALNVELFGWSAGSLLPVLLLATSRRLRWADLSLLAVVALVVLVYGLYWSSGGPDFGPRYWSLVLIPCVGLSARAVPLLGWLLRSADRDGTQSGTGPPTAARTCFARGALALGLAAFSASVTFVPWRAVDKYHDYRGMTPGVRTLTAEFDPGRSLVLVRGDQWPDYASAAIYNPLDLRADQPVYAWDRGPDVRRALLAAYPDRDVWLVAGPTTTGEGYRVMGRLDERGGTR